MTTTSNPAMANKSIIKCDDNAVPRKSLGLYVHIPFCIRKCNYCDFLSFGGTTEEEQSAYFHALAQEIRKTSEVYSKQYYVDSVFIGGGTPSLVDEKLIDETMTAIRDSFSIQDNAEITIETNPKTLTKSKLDRYLNAGINRLSIGVQALDDQLLNQLGRIHTTEDFLNNYHLARASGFQNINIDLMFSIPGQTLKTWEETLQRAIALEPEHLSFYSLQLEEDTPFFDMLQAGLLQETEDSLDREMYHAAIELLASCGYRHYEISNAAKAGFECRHNLKYWSMEDYLGLGLGSHSFMNGTRHSNVTDLMEYIRIGQIHCSRKDEDRLGLQNKGLNQECSPYVHWQHRNTREDNISEYLFTGMRKLMGIELADFHKRFGIDLETIQGEALKKYQENGLIEIKEGWLRFTEKGLDLANTVLAEFV